MKSLDKLKISWRRLIGIAPHSDKKKCYYEARTFGFPCLRNKGNTHPSIDAEWVRDVADEKPIHVEAEEESNKSIEMLHI